MDSAIDLFSGMRTINTANLCQDLPTKAAKLKMWKSVKRTALKKNLRGGKPGDGS